MRPPASNDSPPEIRYSHPAACTVTTSVATLNATSRAFVFPFERATHWVQALAAAMSIAWSAPIRTIEPRTIAYDSDSVDRPLLSGSGTFTTETTHAPQRSATKTIGEVIATATCARTIAIPDTTTAAT